MLWDHYAFRRGSDVQEMWHGLFHARPIKLLYISGRGFDVRAQKVIQQLVETLKTSATQLQSAELLLVRLPGYHLSAELRLQTQTNEQVLNAQFGTLGNASTVIVAASAPGEDDMSPTNALQLGVAAVLARITDHTDIILDVSSLPRIMFLALLNGLLNRLMPDKLATNALAAQGVNLQVVVADDPVLDAQIRSEDPSSDLVTIPGFSSGVGVGELATDSGAPAGRGSDRTSRDSDSPGVAKATQRTKTRPARTIAKAAATLARRSANEDEGVGGRTAEAAGRPESRGVSIACPVAGAGLGSISRKVFRRAARVARRGGSSSPRAPSPISRSSLRSVAAERARSSRASCL